MQNGNFATMISSENVHTDVKADWKRTLQHQYLYKEQPSTHYEASSGRAQRSVLHEASKKNINAALAGVDESYVERLGESNENERHQTAGLFDTTEPSGGPKRNDPIVEGSAVKLKVEHLEPISVRPENNNSQIVNVCQTFRFPNNFITQNNTNGLGQHQGNHLHQQWDLPSSLNWQNLLSQYRLGRLKLDGFFDINRPCRRSMYSQTSRTLLELIEAEQNAQQQQLQPIAVPRTLKLGVHPQRFTKDSLVPKSGSESTMDDHRMSKAEIILKRKLKGNVRPTQMYFNHAEDVDGGDFMRCHRGCKGQHSEMGGTVKQARHSTVDKKTDQMNPLYDDSLKSRFVGVALLKISERCRKEPFDDGKTLRENGNDSDVDKLDSREKQHDGYMDFDEADDDEDSGSKDDGIGNCSEERRNADNRGDEVSTKEGPSGISGIVDKLQNNVWQVCLEGIWDLMNMVGRIDWKAQEKYITVINRRLIEFMKSPRTSLCRSACQVLGELFREAKSTKRPEFDQMVEILLCKTADPNHCIQKDANVALDKLVTYIATPHVVRVLSNRGTIHRNPLVRKATARLLMCICVIAGLDAILGTAANTRTRTTVLAMLAKILTDKNQETRKFGERLYRMLRKHKFFNEYFYKDIDNNLRTSLKRVLKGL